MRNIGRVASSATIVASLIVSAASTAQATIVSKSTTEAVTLDYIAYPTSEVVADQTSPFEVRDDDPDALIATGTIRSTVFREADGTLSFLYRLDHLTHGGSSLEYEGYYLEGFSELAVINAYEANATGLPDTGFGQPSALYQADQGRYRFPYKYDGVLFDILIKTDATEFALDGTFTITGDIDSFPQRYGEDPITVYAPANGGTTPPAVPLPPAVLPGALMLATIAGGSVLRRWRNHRA